MRLVVGLGLAATLAACGIVDTDSDLVVELRQWRVVTAESSQSWLEVRYAVINGTDDTGELDYCCTPAFLTPDGQADSIVLQDPCLRLCPSGPQIAAWQTLVRTAVFPLPAPGEYRLGLPYRVPLQDPPRKARSRAFAIH
jgi:hypothetical protein